MYPCTHCPVSVHCTVQIVSLKKGGGRHHAHIEGARVSHFHTFHVNKSNEKWKIVTFNLQGSHLTTHVTCDFTFLMRESISVSFPQ